MLNSTAIPRCQPRKTIMRSIKWEQNQLNANKPAAPWYPEEDEYSDRDEEIDVKTEHTKPVDAFLFMITTQEVPLPQSKKPQPNKPRPNTIPILPESAIFCDYCKAWLNGPAQWRTHCLGRRHQNRVKGTKYEPIQPSGPLSGL